MPAPRDPSPAATRAVPHPDASAPSPQPTTPPSPTLPPAPSDTRDRALVEAVKAGRPGAWTELVKLYQDRIYSLCLRTCGNPDLASDLAQDTMVKLVQHIDRYDGRCQFFTWVYRITVNTCLTRLRSEKLRRTASLDALDSDDRPTFQVPDRPGEAARSSGSGTRGAPSGELNASERVEQDETRSAVLRAMQSLAPEHATVLILRDAHGLEYQQIADALEISVGTVKSRIFRARAALRDLFENDQGTSLKSHRASPPTP